MLGAHQVQNAATAYVALQVANIFEEAGFVSAQFVRGLILLGVGGLIVTILASWFLETPWKQKKWISVAGDVVIIVAVTLAAALFAWQQWFTSFSRPTVAVLKIEATDKDFRKYSIASANLFWRSKIKPFRFRYSSWLSFFKRR